MKKKKILLVAYACSPTKGSEEGNGWNWATGLARAGYEVWCFTNTAYEKEIRHFEAELGYTNLHFIFVSVSEMADKHLLNPDSKAIYIHYYLWRKKAARIAKRMHEAEKFDIGHHVTYGSLQQGNFLWKLKGLKIIFGPVGGGQKAPAVLKEYFGGPWIFERLRNMISDWVILFDKNFRNSLAKASSLLVTNMETFRMAEKTGFISPEKIFFFPDHAVSAKMENIPRCDHQGSDVFKLLWVGRILPRKGLNLVLEGLSRVPSDLNYSLTIVGGGELFDQLPKWIEKYSLDKNRIHLVGQVPFEEVAKYYRDSDAFIFCTLRDSFPMQITEALAFGLPVITLNLHGSAMVLPEGCGIKITPTTREDTLNGIANAVVKLQKDKDLRNSFSENAFQYIKKHTWRNQVEAVAGKFY